MIPFGRLLLLHARHRPCLARGRGLEYGIVGINEASSAAEAPFGHEGTGIGREGSHSVEEYLEIKYMLMGA
jgi:acyl-CoA reductase-like NAD-dependent aldehyde dehydrogenase